MNEEKYYPGRAKCPECGKELEVEDYSNISLEDNRYLYCDGFGYCQHCQEYHTYKIKFCIVGFTTPEQVY